MNLVKQRLAWEAMYALGVGTDFQPFLDYKENRLSELHRQSRAIEKFYEYTISLERRLKEKEND